MMASEDDRTGAELAELRAELARFVLKEAGAAAAESPGLGLGAALTDVVDTAVRESVEKALRGRRDLDPAAFAERVLRLAEGRAGTAAPASAAAPYEAAAPASAWAQVAAACGRRPLGVVVVALVLLAAVFAAGWFARDRLAPASAPVSTSAEADPDNVLGAQAPAPSSQPAVLNGVELSGRPAVQPAAGTRPRPAAEGRAR